MDSNTVTTSYDFQRYLLSKQRIDDRSLNSWVWQRMVEAIRETKPPRAILELGAGVGTMLERLMERNVLAQVAYTGIDQQEELLEVADQRLREWEPVMRLWEIRPAWLATNVHDFLGSNPEPIWDMIIAHSFLDLVNVPEVLPRILARLRPNGHFYFTLNFDGQTILEPTIDQALDAQIIDLYHRTMDERVIDGRPSGNSHTGRALFQQILDLGGQILAAGSSDWLIFPRSDGYPASETYFLHYIIHTLDSALKSHPELDTSAFEAWINQRHQQVDAGRLTYIAHQLDILGTWPGPAQ